MNKPSPPPPPDYAGAAKAQGAANLEAARASARLSNPSFRNPLGGRDVLFNTGPGGEDAVFVQDFLTPAGQQRFDQEQRIISRLGGMAEEGLGRVQDAVERPFSFGGPSAVTSLPQGSFRGATTTNFNRFDLSGAPNIPGVDDFSADRRRVEEAVLSRIEPQLERDREALRTQLINSGFRAGTEGYNEAMARADKQATDARMQAVLAGGAEQSRLFGMGMGARQQAAAEAQTRGQMGLSAEAQGFQQANAAEQARLAQALSAGTFRNQARQQAIQEAQMLRNLPLNEINALRSGSQVSLPQFQAYSGSQVAPAPMFGAAQAQGGWDQNAFNQRMGAYNATIGGLFDLGAAYAGRPGGR